MRKPVSKLITSGTLFAAALATPRLLAATEFTCADAKWYCEANYTGYYVEDGCGVAFCAWSCYEHEGGALLDDGICTI
jgi:hypothetical protein